MIIKSMSRKHASFAQLIDYIEGEAKLRSRRFSVFHNTYSRDSDRLKADFMQNSEHLRYRKNGVYLYHEVISITRTQSIDEDQQKAALKQIVEEYLHHRGRCNLAYAVLHEDTEHLHFHIVMSANEAGECDRTRLSKVDFAEIQTNLEQWVLAKHPELEQKAVFHKNQTAEERQQRQDKKDHDKAHLSKAGEDLKRRGGKTSIRDDIQEKLADIFTTATDPRHLTDLLEKAGFKLYERGQQHGVIDRDGKKYRLNKLGLSEAWEMLETRMIENLRSKNVPPVSPGATPKDDRDDHVQGKTAEAKPIDTPPPEQTTEQVMEAEEKRRLDEITATRRATQTNARTSNTDRDR